MLKRLPGPPISPSPRLTSHAARESLPYISPLYSPHGNLDHIRTNCSAQTFEILNDMYTLTQGFLHRNDSIGTMTSSRYRCQIYERLLHRPSAQNSPTPDWIHESVRLAALIYTHAIVYRTTFALFASMAYEDTTTSDTTLLYALLHSLEQTDTNNCWGDMRGVFLWICLIGGAASWSTCEAQGLQHGSPPITWVRKCFSLWAIKAVASTGFEHAEETLEALRTGLRVKSLLEEKGA
jgi:hypothetical protein